MITKIHWTQEEREYLQENYATTPITEIKNSLTRRTYSMIRHQAAQLGIKRKIRSRDKKNYWPETRHKKLNSFYLGYMAASIDCEGTISLTKGQKESYFCIQPRVAIGNTCKALIDNYNIRLRGATNNYKGTKTNGKSNYKPKYTFAFQRVRDVLWLLQQIEPYLIVKRKQAKLVIEFCETRLVSKYGRGLSNREVEIYKEIQILNRKGVN